MGCDMAERKIYSDIFCEDDFCDIFDDKTFFLGSCVLVSSIDGIEHLQNVLGVKRVLNAAAEVEGPCAPGLNVLRLDARDSSDFDIASLFERSTAFIAAGLDADPLEPVYVNFKAGVSRSASLVLAYLILRRRI